MLFQFKVNSSIFGTEKLFAIEKLFAMSYALNYKMIREKAFKELWE